MSSPVRDDGLAASSYSPENHTFITCGVSDRAVGFEQIPAASQVVGSFGGIGVAVRLGARHIDRQHRQLLGVGRDDRQVGLAPALGRSVLQRLDEHRVRDHVHRPPRRAGTPRTATATWRRWTRDRSIALEVAADGCTGGRCSRHLHGERQAVRLRRRRRPGHNDVSRPLGLTNPARLRDDAIYTFALP